MQSPLSPRFRRHTKPNRIVRSADVVFEDIKSDYCIRPLLNNSPCDGVRAGGGRQNRDTNGVIICIAFASHAQQIPKTATAMISAFAKFMVIINHLCGIIPHLLSRDTGFRLNEF